MLADLLGAGDQGTALPCSGSLLGAVSGLLPTLSLQCSGGSKPGTRGRGGWREGLALSLMEFAGR